MTDVGELLERLNITDESVTIEAKRAGEIDKSVMETVNAFSNEPYLGGGYLLLGVERDANGQYIVTGISDPDKLQLDLSSQCADSFNLTIRPDIKVETVDGKNVLLVFIPLANQSDGLTTQFDGLTTQLDSLTTQLPSELGIKLEQLGQRSNSKEDIIDIILELCEWKPLSLNQLSDIMGRKDKKYLKSTYMTPLLQQGKLEYTIPEMLNHPKQAYRTVNKK
jgi:predicted HTH transcriptional regulator